MPGKPFTQGALARHCDEVEALCVYMLAGEK